MSIFPTKILLATDGSEEATLAAQTAADIARKTNSELHLVHVAYLLPMSTEASYIASRVYKEAREEVKQEAQALLDEQVRIVEDAGGNLADAHLRAGRPEEEVLRLSEELEAGLIVVAVGGLAR